MRAVPLGLRYQGIGFSIIFSVFFPSKWNGLSWVQKVIDETLPATAPSAHSGFSEDRPCLHLMIIIWTSVYDFSWWGDGAVGKSCAIDLRVAGLNPAGKLLIYFHNVFPVLIKTLCRHSSLVLRSSIKALMRKPRRCSSRPLAPLVTPLLVRHLLRNRLLWPCHRNATLSVKSGPKKKNWALRSPPPPPPPSPNHLTKESSLR